MIIYFLHKSGGGQQATNPARENKGEGTLGTQPQGPEPPQKTKIRARQKGKTRPRKSQEKKAKRAANAASQRQT